MSALLLSAAGATAAVSLVHVIAGHRDPVLVLLASELPEASKRTLHVVWHLVSVELFLSAAALTVVGLSDPAGARLLLLFLGLQFAGYTAVFLTITLTVDWPRPLWRLPQWTLFPPIVALIVLGGWVP
jgi:hypothetical protein